ncbi:hypothetical protein MNB_SUP05-SYMBIONT-7-586 [hydrothermal vent metagenome]|uniref:Uncharacterized protein n=1 Tax=hydrothermal vent metagenome TaxID=652676 RepID=A0A1W1E4T1_9ZZZZ
MKPSAIKYDSSVNTGKKLSKIGGIKANAITNHDSNAGILLSLANSMPMMIATTATAIAKPVGD